MEIPGEISGMTRWLVKVRSFVDSGERVGEGSLLTVEIGTVWSYDYYNLIIQE